MHSNILFLIYEYQPFFLLLKIGAKTSFILNSILFLGDGGGVLGPLDPPPPVKVPLLRRMLGYKLFETVNYMIYVPMSYNSIGMQAEVGLPIGIWGTPLLGQTLCQSKCSIMINSIVSLSRTHAGL